MKPEEEPRETELPVWGVVLFCKAPRSQAPRIYVEIDAPNELRARALVNEKLFGTFWHIQRISQKTGERSHLVEMGHKLPRY